jgi:hypothetical protein
MRVASAAADLETALQNRNDPANPLAALDDAVGEARAAIDAILRRC